MVLMLMLMLMRISWSESMRWGVLWIVIVSVFEGCFVPYFEMIPWRVNTRNVILVLLSQKLPGGYIW